MRNKHYKKKQFRLSEEIYRFLLFEKKKENVTWNILFTKFKNDYEYNNKKGTK